MKNKSKKTSLYGIIYETKEKDTKNFDDSELFPKDIQIRTLLKRIRIYIKNKQRLYGIESYFVNYISGEKKQSEYHGGNINSKDIEFKELTVKSGEYINNIDFAFDQAFQFIIYFKIMTNKNNSIEFGEKKDKVITILNFSGDNAIQSFFGNYDNNGINNIGFQYVSISQFILYHILPILKLRYKINHNEDIKKKYDSNYKSLLKDNISMMYLYRTCILPDSIFANIINYC